MAKKMWMNLKELVSDFCEKSFDVVAGLCRRLEEVHSVTLRKLVADFARNLAVVAIRLVA
jgi:hypothetical protein